MGRRSERAKTVVELTLSAKRDLRKLKKELTTSAEADLYKNRSSSRKTRPIRVLLMKKSVVDTPENSPQL